MRRRLFSVLFLLSSSSVGCAGGDEPPVFVFDSGKHDTGSVSTDTGVLREDTNAPPIEDSGTVDTSVPVDTGTEADSATADSALDSSIDSTTTDSASEDTTTTDTSVAMDTAIDDTSVVDTGVVVDTALPGDGGTTAPIRLLTGSSLVLHGVTTDNYAIVTDSTGVTSAVPLAGGAPQTIGSAASRVWVSNSVAFVWGTTDLYGFGSLRVWSAATGATSVATKSLAPSTTNGAALYVASASQDGQFIFYTDGGVGGASDRADLKVARTDGTSARTVFTQYIVWDGSLSGYEDYCAPYAGWVGSRFVTTHCTPSGSTVSFDVSSIDPATGSTTSLGTNLSAYWTSDEAGARVAIVSSGSLRIMAPNGTSSTLIDSSVSSGMFTKDGSAFIYRTSANALRRSPSTSSSPITLVSSGVSTLLSGPSSDDKWILYASTGSSGAYDVRRASTTSASTTILNAAANADVYGAGFTADGAYAIYYSAVSSTTLTGDLVAYPMAGGSPITLGANAWYDIAATGSKLVFNDNWVSTSTSGNATLRVRDIASGATTTIATADQTFSVTSARDRVVYVVTSGTDAGLWVASIP